MFFVSKLSQQVRLTFCGGKTAPSSTLYTVTFALLNYGFHKDDITFVF